VAAAQPALPEVRGLDEVAGVGVVGQSGLGPQLSSKVRVQQGALLSFLSRSAMALNPSTCGVTPSTPAPEDPTLCAAEHQAACNKMTAVCGWECSTRSPV
jgi:hypothetical protein